MNSIAIYKILNRIPDTSEAEARDVANSIAHVDDVATKADLTEIKTELKSDIAELRTEIAILKTELIKWMLVFSSIIIAAVGLFNKF